MALDVNHYNALFLHSPGQNDATKYGVTISPCERGPDVTIYRCIGIHHLTPEENAGNHNAYFDVLDEQGHRIPQAAIEWTWQGRQLHEPAPPAVIDKPDTEPGTNIAMSWAQTISASVLGHPTDTVLNIHTRHPDEGHSGGNTRGHHSFYVVFQRYTPGQETPPTDPNCEQHLLRIAQLDATLDVTMIKLKEIIQMIEDA